MVGHAAVQAGAGSAVVGSDAAQADTAAKHAAQQAPPPWHVHSQWV